MSKSWVGVIAACAAAVASAPASAQRITLPAGFHEQPGGDAYRALAQGAEVHQYRAGHVTLTTIELAFAPAAPTREAVARFDLDLVAKTREGTQVSDTRAFDFEPMLAETFDQTETERIYHRKLYRLDAAGAGHLWWVVCRGPATEIGACEQAQRTMTLAGASPGAPAPTPAAPMPSAPAPTPDEPWSFVVPPGFTKVATPDAALAAMRSIHDVRRVEAAAYRSHAPRVALVVVEATLDVSGERTWELVETLDDGASKVPSGATNISRHRTHAGETLISDVSADVAGQSLHGRAFYEIGTDDVVYMLQLRCIGPWLR